MREFDAPYVINTQVFYTVTSARTHSVFIQVDDDVSRVGHVQLLATWQSIGTASPVGLALFLRNSTAAMTNHGDDMDLLLAALTVALEALPGRAFLVDANGGVLRSNSAGQESLARGGAAELVDAQLSGVGPDMGTFRVKEFALENGEVYRLVFEGSPLEGAATRARKAAEVWRLTRRQTDVLVLLAKGLPSKTIAKELGCALNTVEAHVATLLLKSGCRSRSAVLAALWSERFESVSEPPPRRRASERG
jgi:DNA-binding CsgD family transcriptional regulator